MRALNKTALGLVLLAGSVTVPVALAAQLSSPGSLASQTKAGVPKTDQQKSGEALFYQKCTFCHVFSSLKQALIPQYLAPTELLGLYTRPAVTDDAVRRRIIEGIAGRMPGFRYSLTSKEIDDVIAYLKIR